MLSIDLPQIHIKTTARNPKTWNLLILNSLSIIYCRKIVMQMRVIQRDDTINEFYVEYKLTILFSIKL